MTSKWSVSMPALLEVPLLHALLDVSGVRSRLVKAEPE
jgi:hypothetical protein